MLDLRPQSRGQSGMLEKLRPEFSLSAQMTEEDPLYREETEPTGPCVR